VFDEFIAIECVGFAGGRMRQRTNFKAFKGAEDVRKFLEAQLPIGVATPIDVFSFLGEQHLTHSGYINTSRYVHSAKPEPFGYIISSAAPSRRIGWLFEAFWHIRFYFDDQKLAQIEVERTGIGL
jgi:hypothetical protein